MMPREAPLGRMPSQVFVTPDARRPDKISDTERAFLDAVAGASGGKPVRLSAAAAGALLSEASDLGFAGDGDWLDRTAA